MTTTSHPPPIHLCFSGSLILSIITDRAGREDHRIRELRGWIHATSAGSTGNDGNDDTDDDNEREDGNDEDNDNDVMFCE